MNCIEAGRNKRVILDRLKKEEELKRSSEKSLVTLTSVRVSIMKQMNSTIKNWNRRGVYTFEQFTKYINDPNNKKPVSEIKRYNTNINRYELTFEYHKEDKELHAIGKRRCAYCEEIEKFDKFVRDAMGKLKGYQCRMCKGLGR